MAIYNRWGATISIVANCGQHQPKGFVTSVTLVLVRFEDGKERYQFVEFLKADEGWEEVQAAVSAAPVVNLDKKILRTAIEQAR